METDQRRTGWIGTRRDGLGGNGDGMPALARWGLRRNASRDYRALSDGGGEGPEQNSAVSDSRCMQNSTALCICIGGLGVLAVRYCPWNIPSEVPQLKYLCLSTAINRAMFGGAVKTSVAMSFVDARIGRAAVVFDLLSHSHSWSVCLSACPSVCMYASCDLWSVYQHICTHPRSSLILLHSPPHPSPIVCGTWYLTQDYSKVSPRRGAT